MSSSENVSTISYEHKIEKNIDQENIKLAEHKFRHDRPLLRYQSSRRLSRRQHLNTCEGNCLIFVLHFLIFVSIFLLVSSFILPFWGHSVTQNKHEMKRSKAIGLWGLTEYTENKTVDSVSFFWDNDQGVCAQWKKVLKSLPSQGEICETIEVDTLECHTNNQMCGIYMKIMFITDAIAIMNSVLLWIFLWIAMCCTWKRVALWIKFSMLSTLISILFCVITILLWVFFFQDFQHTYNEEQCELNNSCFEYGLSFYFSIASILTLCICMYILWKHIYMRPKRIEKHDFTNESPASDVMHNNDNQDNIRLEESKNESVESDIIRV